jgi:hypothetical protein
MKRLMVVGGLAVTLAVAALQHSPPAQSSTPEIKAALVASALSFEPVPKIDLRVTDYTAPMPIVALATSRSNGPGWIRPTRRYSGTVTNLNTQRTRHKSIPEMRGWEFL